jgi:hypothetical protein
LRKLPTMTPTFFCMPRSRSSTPVTETIPLSNYRVTPVYVACCAITG